MGGRTRSVELDDLGAGDPAVDGEIGFYSGAVKAKTPTGVVRLAPALPPGLPALADLLYFMDDGIRGSYPGSGSVLNDIGGNEPPATLSNVAVTDSRLDWNAATSIAEVTKTAALDDVFDGGATVHIWCTLRSNGGGTFGHLLSTRGALADGEGWAIFSRGPNANGCALEFSIWYTGTDGLWLATQTSDEDAIPYDRPVLITVRYTSGAANVPRFSIDGGNETDMYTLTTPTGTRVSDVGNAFCIGNVETDLSRATDGTISNVAIYSGEQSDAEVRQYYTATLGKYQSGGMALIDRAVATADVSSLTVYGIKSESDEVIEVTGRILFAAKGIFELRPETGAALSSIESTIFRGEIGENQQSEDQSSTGWAVVNYNEGPSADKCVGFFTARIWTAKERHGATAEEHASARLYHSSGVLLNTTYSTTLTINNQAGGHWRTTLNTDSFEAITIESPTGITILKGSEISVRRLPQGADPI